MNIVISQPMFLPWVGLFEQLRLSDVFVHYDDVQMPGKGNFVNRVQVKTAHGIKWLTIPVKHVKGTPLKINEVEIRNDLNWRKEHVTVISANYANAPHYGILDELLGELYRPAFALMGDFCIHCFETVARFFGIHKTFIKSSALQIDGQSSERVVAIVKHLQGTNYISGLGALKYINYDLFEQNGIALRYMDYQKKPYPQLYGEFTPYVSIIDLIANCGKNGVAYICSNAIYWKEYIERQNPS